jgi:glycosyltransferase involved in cell wall biosynthesis
MKILIVDVYGSIHSTGKITTLQYQYFKSKGYDVKVCYRGIREPKIDSNDYIPIAGSIEPYVGFLISRITGYEGTFHPIATKRLKKITLSFNPDVVQLNILHGYYINSCDYIKFLKKKGYPICYSMLDEYAYMGKCAFSFNCNKFMDVCGKCPERKTYPKSLFFDRSEFIQEAKRKAYTGLDKIVFTGPEWIVKRSKQSSLLRDKECVVLDEPINFDKIFYPRETNKLRNKLNIPESNKIVVTVSQMSDPRKGGIYFYKVAEYLKEKTNISFVYVGCDIEEPMRLPNLISIPFISSQDELATYYSLGDLFVCTSLADSMPNVCLDAMGCGTPLAGFDAAGTPYVAPKEFGTFTPTYNIKALAKTILSAPIKTKLSIKQCRDYAVGRYSTTVIFDKLEAIYKSII